MPFAPVRGPWAPIHAGSYAGLPGAGPFRGAMRVQWLSHGLHSGADVVGAMRREVGRKRGESIAEFLAIDNQRISRKSRSRSQGKTVLPGKIKDCGNAILFCGGGLDRGEIPFSLRVDDGALDAIFAAGKILALVDREGSSGSRHDSFLFVDGLNGGHAQTRARSQ